jgi:hypothetical protein
MVTVFVWDMALLSWNGKDPAGHASMAVDDTYISWWPEHFRSDVGFGGVKGRGVLGWGGPSYANSMAEDKRHKGRMPDFASAPIHCLDERAIIDWWNGIKPKNKACQTSYHAGENTYYDLARLSCATIVMRALLMGGGAKIAKPSIPLVSAAAKGVLSSAGTLGVVLAEAAVGDAIAPLDVKRYANALANSKANAAAAGKRR